MIAKAAKVLYFYLFFFRVRFWLFRHGKVLVVEKEGNE